MRPRSTPTRSSSAPVKTPGRSFLADFRAGRSGPALRIEQCARLSDLPPVRRDLIKRHLYLVPNSLWCHAAARMRATSATRKHSSRAANHSTRKPSTRRWPRSIGCRAAISTSSTIISWAIHDLRRRCSTACTAWAGLWQAAATVQSVLGAGLAGEGRAELACAACSWASRRSIPHNLREQHKYQNLHPRLQRRDPPPARSGRDGQRQLCVRYGRRR